MADQPTSNSPYVFEPPSGGDISLRSADGKVFCLHSIILRLTSSVFSDMFTIGTQSAEVVNLAEDSEAISLMLGFMYPSTMPPIISNFKMLEKSLEVAQKYHVETMLQKIDQALSQETRYRPLVMEEPFHLFQLCARYGLRETQTAAARLVRPGRSGLLHPEGIVKLAQQNPGSAHIIGLLGAQLARENILRSVLFDFTVVPDFLQGFEAMFVTCKDCRDKMEDEDGTSTPVYYPGWLQRWGGLVYERLSSPVRDNDSYVFSAGVLHQLRRFKGLNCQACIDAALEAGGRPFEGWAAEVEYELKTQLEKLDVLYSL